MKRYSNGEKVSHLCIESGVARSTFYKWLKEIVLQSISTTSKKTYQKWKKCENKNILQRQFHPEEPNRIWVSDITTFKFHDQYYFICAIMDLFSRKGIAYRISKKNSTNLLPSPFVMLI